MTHNQFRMVAAGVLLLLACGGLVHYAYRVKEMENDATIWSEVLIALHETDTGLISVQSGRTTIRYANTDACDIFGYSPEHMGGLELGAILPEWFQDTHKKIMLGAMEAASRGTLQKRNSTMPCTAIRKDGTTIKVIVRVIIGKSRVVALVNKAEDMNYLEMKYPMDPKAKPLSP